MRLIVALILIGAAFWAYNEHLIPGLNQPSGAFAADGSARIHLYTTPECGAPCDQAAGELRKRRATFEKIEVSPNNEDSATQQWKALGRPNLPYLMAGEATSTVSNGPEVASVLARAFGDKHLNSDEKTLYEKHFNNYDEPIVVMYGADWCPYCQKLQKALTEEAIEFIEIDVPKHRNKNGIMKTMDIRGYPSTWYGYHRVSGVDLKAVKRTIKSASH